MKRTLLIMGLAGFASWGCSSSGSGLDQSTGGSPGSGGTTTVNSGGSTGSSSGGKTGTSSGGTVGSGGAGSTAKGGSGGGTGPGTGGSTTVGQGGTTGTASGGSTGMGSGGSTTTASGGSTGAGTDGSVYPGTGGSGAGPDAGSGFGRDARGGARDSAGNGGAQGTGGGVGAGGATGAGGSSAACVPAATGGPTGMNTGQDCMSCHNAQNPRMTLAGTVYSKATGGTGVSGATVTVTDKNGTKVTLVTGSSGNFYSTTALTFPATVEVSKCPDTAKMTATVPEGGCNSCHDTSMRIHLP